MANFLQKEGDRVVRLMKESTYFPYKSGNLKYNATSGQLITNNTYEIKFDSTIAPYVVFLEEGTKPHDIPHAFGRDLPFGIGGRFDGKFHSGSYKHYHFIEKLVIEMVRNIALKHHGKVEKI